MAALKKTDLYIKGLKIAWDEIQKRMCETENLCYNNEAN